MAYAAVTTLLQSIERLLQPNPYIILHNNVQIEYLHEKVKFLQGFLEDSDKKRYDRESIKHLEWEIREVSYKAGDTIESKIRKICLAKRAKNRKKAYRILRRSLQQVAEEIDSIKKKLVKVSKEKKDAVKVLPAGEVLPSGLSVRVSNMEHHAVGLDTDLQNIKDQLKNFPPKLKTIPIVGMGGVGKTTLARRLYEDPCIVLDFHVRLWVTVSQEYRFRLLLQDLYRLSNAYAMDNADLLLQDLCQLSNANAMGNTDLLLQELCQLSNANAMDNADLALRLRKNLKGRRYLIVMDDIWNTEAWDDVNSIFPDDENGSRIILTSRLKDVAVYANPESPHQMNLLSEVDSWNLLRQKVFAGERCPPELEDIGEKIAAKCQGLPLAIVVVAGCLLKINRTRECWEQVADSVASYVTGDPCQCLDIVALSYNHLPHHLKACFLYLGAFPEDHELPASKLIRMWIAEGFLKQAERKSLEEVAEDSLVDLINRNLIMVRRSSYGRIKTCVIHDILRDFCLREAQKENFLHIMDHYNQVFHEGKSNLRRLSFHSDCCLSNLPTSHICSLLCYTTFSICSFFSNAEFKLLRVLDIMCSQFNQFPIAIVQLVSLRFLALSIADELPSSISTLWNLQTLVLDCSSGATLPWEIWKMPQLRHLHFTSCSFLPDPVGTANDGNGDLVLRNLQTLSKLSLSCCTMEVCTSLPNLKKLGVCETAEAHIIEKAWLNFVVPSDHLFSSNYSVESKWSNISNVALLLQLETLKLKFINLFAAERRWVPRVDEFPPNLKKLTLSFSYLPWANMTILSMLPNLEVLKLKHYAFVGSEWEQYEEGFSKLKYLLLYRTDLVRWRATSTQFPSLQHLVLNHCLSLREVPLDFAEITSLKTIDVYDSVSAVKSVMQIKEEGERNGNYDLVVRIHSAF